MAPRIEENWCDVIVRDDETGAVLARVGSLAEAGLFVAGLQAATDAPQEPRGFFDELFFGSGAG